MSVGFVVFATNQRINEKFTKARIENIVIQETETELLIYDLISNKALCLNETCKTIWQACDGKTTFAQLRKSTSDDFSDEIIFLTLEELQKKKLLLEKVKFELPAGKRSRRKMVAKYGAIAISLPVIVAIAAPTSLNAQSVCVCIGGSCATGACMCPSGQTNCSNTCRNLNTDNMNCGMCGTICFGGEFMACVSGTCI